MKWLLVMIISMLPIAVQAQCPSTRLTDHKVKLEQFGGDVSAMRISFNTAQNTCLSIPGSKPVRHDIRWNGGSNTCSIRAACKAADALYEYVVEIRGSGLQGWLLKYSDTTTYPTRGWYLAGSRRPDCKLQQSYAVVVNDTVRRLSVMPSGVDKLCDTVPYYYSRTKKSNSCAIRLLCSVGGVALEYQLVVSGKLVRGTLTVMEEHAVPQPIQPVMYRVPVRENSGRRRVVLK